MMHQGMCGEITDKLREKSCGKQFPRRYTEFYGELLDAAVLGYGPISLGHEAAKELYWLKMAADYGDEKSVRDLQERCQF